MTGIIIDRTQTDSTDKKKNLVNRRKFMKRVSDRLKKSVKKYIANDADIKDITDGKKKKVRMSDKTLKEPNIINDKDNDSKGVLVGNKTFEKGDKVAKPNGGCKSKRGGSGPDSEEGEDDFYFTITHDEFVDLFFEDLELPDLIKKQMTEKDTEIRPAGFTTDGPPSKLDLRKTLHNSLKRSFAVSGSINQELEYLKDRLDNEDLNEEQKNDILSKIEELELKKKTIPFLQELDLRYRKVEHVPIPTTKSVMFCVMDVSYSMSEWHKEMAKRFFMVLYLFLTRQYETVDLVFVRHHHEAKEVDEKEFFYGVDTGGTVVSSALDLVNKIIEERYSPNIYNIYLAQASDGDNYTHNDETIVVQDLLKELLPKIQYHAYVEITDQPTFEPKELSSTGSELMELYGYIKKSSKEAFQKINMRVITGPETIYKVFRSLFKAKK